MKIYGYQKTTLLDYPGHVAATIFTPGCNFRCPFCHNSELILSSDSSAFISTEEILSFLYKRKNLLSGLCITGGEPTLQPGLSAFIKEVRALGYKIKLDTNGYQPQVLTALLQDKLLDYIAMDIKAGFTNYSSACGIADIDIQKIKDSISILETSGITYEFRTTVVKELHSKKDFYEIRHLLSPTSPYYLQSFCNTPNILSPGLSACDKTTLTAYQSILCEKLLHVTLRT